MTQYIDKAVLVAEMKRRISNLEQLGDRQFIVTHFPEQYKLIEVYEGIIDFLDILEVKDVDLEKELSILDRTLFDLNGVAVKGATYCLTVEDVKDIAKHFFELGLKTQKGE